MQQRKSCKGYKVASCWHTPIPTKEFCHTCHNRYAADKLQTFINGIAGVEQQPFLTKEEIAQRFEDPEIQHALLNQYGGFDAIDSILITMFRRSRPLALNYVKKMFASRSLRSPLISRMRNHSHTEFCNVLGYVIRNGYYEIYHPPIRCLTCTGHLVARYNDPEMPLADAIRLRDEFLGARCEANISIVMQTHLQWYPIVMNFWKTLRENRCPTISQRVTERMHTCLDMVRRLQPQQYRAFTEEAIHRHPFNITIDLPVTRQWIRQRIEPHKEKLTAKSWHPSRMQHWCLDTEEQKDIGLDDVPQPPLRPGEPAEWNIHW